MKLDANGNIVWQKCLGGSDYDNAYSIQQTTDGGFIVAGYSESNDGDVSGNHGDDDYWIVKLDANGNIVWQKFWEEVMMMTLTSIQQTTDGGFIVAGFSNSNDGDVSGNHAVITDYWIVKVRCKWKFSLAKMIRRKLIYDVAYSIQQTTDSGFIVAGSSDSNDGDVSGNHR